MLNNERKGADARNFSDRGSRCTIQLGGAKRRCLAGPARCGQIRIGEPCSHARDVNLCGCVLGTGRQKYGPV